MIQDQYEEEYFVSFLNSKKPSSHPSSENNSQNSSLSNSPGKPAMAPGEQQLTAPGMVYKYYSELSAKDLDSYECRPDIGSNQ